MVLGSGLGVLLVVGLITLIMGLLTGSPLPLPGWPDAVHGEAGNPAATAPAVAPQDPTPIPTPNYTPGPGTTPTSPGAVPTTHGNGNGNSHRPTKSPPGKP
jgi:hypothetical protein